MPVPIRSVYAGAHWLYSQNRRVEEARGRREGGQAHIMSVNVYVKSFVAVTVRHCCISLDASTLYHHLLIASTTMRIVVSDPYGGVHLRAWSTQHSHGWSMLIQLPDQSSPSAMFTFKRQPQTTKSPPLLSLVQ